MFRLTYSSARERVGIHFDLSEEGCRLYIDTFNRQEHLMLALYPGQIPAHCRILGAWKEKDHDNPQIWYTILEYVDE